MATGKQDWSDNQSLTSYLDSSDLMEVSARVAQTFRFYRGGNVLFYTGFETNDDYVNLHKSVPGVTLQKTNSFALTGQYCLECSVPTINDYGELQKVIPAITSRYMAISGAIDITNLDGLCYVSLTVYDGAQAYIPVLRFKSSNQRIAVQLADTSTPKITDYSTLFVTDDKHWIPFKMWIDLELGEYLKLDVFGVEYDLSGQAMPVAATTVNPCVYVTWRIDANTAGVSAGNLDYLMVTTNDPS